MVRCTNRLSYDQNTAWVLLLSAWHLLLLYMLLLQQHWLVPPPIAGLAQQQLAAPLLQSGPTSA